MAFLCHIILSDKIEVDPTKIEADKNCPRLLALTDIRRFLRLAGYYRRFLDGFVSIASSLTTLTQKSVKCEW